MPSSFSKCLPLLLSKSSLPASEEVRLQGVSVGAVGGVAGGAGTVGLEKESAVGWASVPPRASSV